MAYEFVYESEAKRYRSDCSRTLKKTCELLREKGISAQFTLVGSGARNMITRNGDGPYDLDYNLLVVKADDEYRDPLLLKDTIRNTLNKAVGGKFFSDAQDSTSCLTALLHFIDTPNVEFSFDVAITTSYPLAELLFLGKRILLSNDFKSSILHDLQISIYSVFV